MTDPDRPRILYVAGAFPPAKSYGGPTESGYHLCAALLALGVDVRVVSIAADGEGPLGVQSDCWSTYRDVPVFYARRLGKTFIAPRVCWDIGEAWRDIDLVHVSGSFSLLLPVAAARSRLHDVPLVFSPRGSLLPEALARHRGRKTLFNISIGGLAYRQVSGCHVTSEEEARHVARWMPRAKIAVIPNGVQPPLRENWPHPSATGARPPYLVYLGRLHPHKQIDRILHAFARASHGTKAELWLTGDGEREYVAGLEGLAGTLGIRDRVRFLGYVAGEDKSAVLSHARALVLASRSENFGLSVAEALAHGTPCVVTRSAPWSGLATEGCGIWVDDSVEGVAGGMRSMLGCGDEERREMGARARTWMARDFTWHGVASKMLELYRRAGSRERKRPAVA